MKMETIKKNAMALVALAIAATSVTLMSFGTSDAPVKKVDDLHWFIVEEDGSGYRYSDSNQPGGTPSPETGCTSTIDITPLCAVAFTSDELDGNQMPSEPNPENALTANKRYQSEP